MKDTYAKSAIDKIFVISQPMPEVNRLFAPIGKRNASYFITKSEVEKSPWNHWDSL